MSRLDIYKKQAKQLVRWHRAGNYSIGGRIRGLARYQTLTDREALALEFPLREAQEIIALEAGNLFPPRNISFEAPRCDRVVAAVFEQIEAIDQSSLPK
jgi:hypothetical protein